MFFNNLFLFSFNCKTGWTGIQYYPIKRLYRVRLNYFALVRFNSNNGRKEPRFALLHLTFYILQ